MKYKDVEEKFLLGDKLIVIFGIKKLSYSIGGEKITAKTYDKLYQEYKTQSHTIIETGGLTKHTTTYKP